MDFSRQKAQKAQILPSRPAERGESRREGFPFLSLLRLFAAMPTLQSAMQPVAPFDCAFVPHADYLIIASNFCQAPVAKPSPVKYPARIAPLAESGELRAAERQIGTQGCDSRSVLDRAGAVSGLNPGQPAA